MGNFISQFFGEAVQLFIAMTPYLMVGMFFSGLLHIVMKESFVVQHVGSQSLLSVVKASLFGVPLPLCSCGVVPTALYLKRAKASDGAVLSFLISTPQTGVDSLVAAYGMLGPVMAVARAVAAFATGILGGILSMAVSLFSGNEAPEESPAEETQEDSCCCSGSCSTEVHQHEEDSTSLISKVKSLFSFGFLEFTDDVAGSFLFGLAVAAGISLLIPDDFFRGSLLGEGIIGMLVMIVIGIPFYICSTSSIPVAVAFILKGVSPGAAFVFLMVGPATNAATVSILKRQFGLKMVITYIASISLGALFFGVLIDFLTEKTSLVFFNPAGKVVRELGETGGFSSIEIGAAVLFLLLLLYTFGKRLLKGFK